MKAFSIFANIQAVKWAKFCLFVSGGGLSAFFGDWHKPSTWAGALIGAAGAIGTLLPTPPSAIAENAKVVNSAGKEVAFNVSSTSELLKPPLQA